MLEAELWLKEHGFKAEQNYRYTTLDDDVNQFRLREEYIRTFGFAIPNKKALQHIKHRAPILEVGAGSGYWAYELEKWGVDIIATDPQDSRYRSFGFWDKPYTTVVKVHGIAALERYPDRTLMMCWPDYDDAWTDEVLAAYHGNRVIYVGEGEGGCTGSEKFHEILNAHFEEESRIDIPQWFGIHDSLVVYKRQGSELEAPKRKMRGF